MSQGHYKQQYNPKFEDKYYKNNRLLNFKRVKKQIQTNVDKNRFFTLHCSRSPK